MKKFNIYALFIVALTLGLASCTKDNLYRPGGAETELQNDSTIPTDDNIVDPGEIEEEDDEADTRKGKG